MSRSLFPLQQESHHQCRSCWKIRGCFCRTMQRRHNNFRFAWFFMSSSPPNTFMIAAVGWLFCTTMNSLQFPLAKLLRHSKVSMLIPNFDIAYGAKWETIFYRFKEERVKYADWFSQWEYRVRNEKVPRVLISCMRSYYFNGRLKPRNVNCAGVIMRISIPPNFQRQWSRLQHPLLHVSHFTWALCHRLHPSSAAEK